LRPSDGVTFGRRAGGDGDHRADSARKSREIGLSHEIDVIIVFGSNTSSLGVLLGLTNIVSEKRTCITDPGDACPRCSRVCGRPRPVRDGGGIGASPGGHNEDGRRLWQRHGAANGHRRSRLALRVTARYLGTRRAP
jgi:hypothetical protein